MGRFDAPQLPAWQPESGTKICALSDMGEKLARGFTLENENGEKLNIIIWRDAAHDGAENLAAFVNQCPHLGLPLETFPDRFLAANGESLICSAHGAQFDKKGNCFAGPCEGRALVALALQLAGDDILIA